MKNLSSIFVLGILLLLTSCSKDSDEKKGNSAIIGTWEYISRGKTTDIYKTYVFLADGTGSYKYVKEKDWVQTDFDFYVFQYSIVGDELTVNDNKYKFNLKDNILEITDTQGTTSYTKK